MVKEVNFESSIQDNPRICLDEQIADNHKEHFINIKDLRALGSIYTPPAFAKFLTSWAIRYSNETILDIGIGEGAFVFSTYYRLLEVGATAVEAQKQIFGAEIDLYTFRKFTEAVKSIDPSMNFPNLRHANFFETDFPLVDAIVGNPPYVRRAYIENVDKIRQMVVEKNNFVGSLNMTRLTDLYVYFLLHSFPLLKPGGRLAVIASDTWLNASYGEEFKKYLLQHFKIESLISLDKRVFEDALVKPVLILATKKTSVEVDWPIHFIRVKNGASINNLQQSLNDQGIDNPHFSSSLVQNSNLNTTTPWSIYFKAPEAYEKISSYGLMSPMCEVAETRIGLQTLAKDFFVLTAQQAQAYQIEPEFLEPLAQSIRYINKPTIDPDISSPFYLFCCSKSKDELQGTNALKYILSGESTEVEVRGKNLKVLGYHNKERIKRSHRRLWYDLHTSLLRRGRASILIPRLIYRKFTMVWNRGGFVPGELFIEFLPHAKIDAEVYLAILSSTIAEIALRTSAQIYGGGTYNISPGGIKRVPILNPELMTQQQRDALRLSYLQYLTDVNHNRAGIDTIIYQILDVNAIEQQELKVALDDLLLLATSLKEDISHLSDR